MQLHYAYATLKKRLTDSNLKATQQRIVVYEALAGSCAHPTSEEIFEIVRVSNPSISLATIYKTLDTFVAAGIAAKVSTSEGISRYDANMDSHNHIYCINTREILDYEDKELTLLIEAYFNKKEISNLKIKDIRLQIHGEKTDVKKEIIIK